MVGHVLDCRGAGLDWGIAQVKFGQSLRRVAARSGGTSSDVCSPDRDARRRPRRACAPAPARPRCRRRGRRAVRRSAAASASSSELPSSRTVSTTTSPSSCSCTVTVPVPCWSAFSIRVCTTWAVPPLLAIARHCVGSSTRSSRCCGGADLLPSRRVLAQQRSDVDGLARPLGVRARQAEQLGDRRVEAVGVAQGEVGLGAHVVVAELGDLLQAQAQGGQRRAQLMRGVRRELPLGGDHRADAFGAGVQRRRRHRPSRRRPSAAHGR